MAHMNIPNNPKLYYSYYNNLKGADYSVDATECDKSRSPNMVNMISDDGGNPVKRLGWRKVNTIGSNIQGIYLSGDTKYVIADNGIYIVISDVVNQIIDKSITSAKMFTFNGSIYAFADGYYKFSTDNYGIVTVETIIMTDKGPGSAYVPTVVIGQKPNGTGGTYYEDVNLLTEKRIISFLGDSTSTDYLLEPNGKLWNGGEFYGNVTGHPYYIENVEVLTANGWVQQYEGTDFTLHELPTGDISQDLRFWNEDKIEDYLEDPLAVLPTLGYITFTGAHAPIVVGQDNVKITFKVVNLETATTVYSGAWGQPIPVCKGYYNEIRDAFKETSIVKTFGVNNMDRIFCSLLTKKFSYDVSNIVINRIYYSEPNKANYFPDTNYVITGHTGKVKGFHRFNGYLVAITDSSDTEGTIFLIKGTTLDGDTVFAVTPATSTTGAVSGGSFVTLVDEPLFLSNSGIYAITSNYANLETIIRNRSAFIDKKLLAEPNLQNAVACVWNKYYILCVNNNCYILDGRQTSKDSKGNTNFVYECYYWENIPATAFATNDSGELWFGTADGYLCKFNTDIDDISAYCDYGIKTDNIIIGGVPIPAKYTTCLDTDGNPQYFKSIVKKGVVVQLVPFDKSSAIISFSKDGARAEEIGELYIGTYDDNSSAQSIFPNKKIKKYKTLQFILQNDNVNEPFGILGLTKTYTVDNFAK